MSPAQLHRRPGKEGYSAHANIWSIKTVQYQKPHFKETKLNILLDLCVSPLAQPAHLRLAGAAALPAQQGGLQPPTFT